MMSHGDGTALCRAAEYGTLVVAELLLRHGADVTLGAPLCFAMRRRDNKAMVELLLKHGADVDGHPDKHLPLMDAIYQQNTDVLRLLVNHGASVDIAFPDRCNAALSETITQYNRCLYLSFVDGLENRKPRDECLYILELIVARCSSFQVAVKKRNDALYR